MVKMKVSIGFLVTVTMMQGRNITICVLKKTWPGKGAALQPINAAAKLASQQEMFGKRYHESVSEIFREDDKYCRSFFFF